MGKSERYIMHGVYADLIKKYIEYKRSLGYKMEDVEIKLAVFDRLTVERGETKIGISKELFEEYGKRTPWETERNRYGRISKLRAFSAFLRLLGYDSYIGQLPSYKSNFTPYIFTKEQLNKIYQEADKLHCPYMRMNSAICVIPSLLRYLGCTGSRVGEALQLKHSDVDIENDTVLVRGSKNGEERIIAISPSVREVLLDYWSYKESIGLQCTPDNNFFTSPDGSPIGIWSVYYYFRILLYRVGIPHMGAGNGPRVHDLRHTFCVHALAAMSEAGMDLYTSMPILMRYVGHKSLASTNQYVRITEEMFPNLICKVNELYRYIFPELDPETFELDFNNEDD